ncbi:MAG: PKD domain-containing protein [Nitrososphaera sp.]
MILGNDIANYIDSKGGDDCIIAFGDDDTVYDYNSNTNSGGTDWLFGSDGNDKLYALNGDDYVYGGAGNDTMLGNDGNDKMYGEAGADTINSEYGNDSIDGGGIDSCPDTQGSNTVVNCELPIEATLNQWSLYSSSGADGTPLTQFTFSASAPGTQKFEWDFDGNGTMDATTPATASQAKASHTYGRAGTFEPKVRAIDSFGQTSAWTSLDERLDITGAAVQDTTYCDDRTIEQLIASDRYKVFDGRMVRERCLPVAPRTPRCLAAAGETE